MSNNKVPEPVAVSPDQLKDIPIPQLDALKKNLTAEVDQLSQAFASLKVALDRIETSVSTLEPLKKEKEGTRIMVPITSSLYVPGQIVDVEKVLVDVGTGYFIEKKIPEAQEVLKRRVKVIKDSMAQLQKRILIQQQNIQSITIALNKKVQQELQSQQK